MATARQPRDSCGLDRRQHLRPEPPRPATERQVLTSIAEDHGGLYSKASGNPRRGSTTAALESLVAEGEVVSDHTRRTGYRVVDPLLVV